MKEQTMAHERLDVYRCAIEFVALAHHIGQRIPRGEGELRDQLRRAAMSIPLNIAEGIGKTSDADRRRLHAIARGSTLECAAVLDVLTACSMLEPDDVKPAKTYLGRLVSMLTRLCLA